MSSEKVELEKPGELEKSQAPTKSSVKKKVTKVTIDEREYTNKLVDCTPKAYWVCVKTGVATVLLVPFVLHKLRFIPTTVEVRAATGLLSAIVGSYWAAKRAREKCLELVKENYEYIPTF